MIRAKKHFGQHFLTSPQVVRRLVETISIDSSVPIIEIGPGTGVVTEELLKRFDHIYAIEKDVDMITLLSDKFHDAIDRGQLTLIEGDAAECNPDALGITGHYVVVGNIPYNITGLLFKNILSLTHQPREIIFLIQREVAERIVERDGTTSVLSLSVSIYGDPTIVSHVKAGAFNPPPHVASSIVHVASVSRDRLVAAHITDDEFFKVVKKGFRHKRKKLRNNLEVPANVLTEVGIDSEIRAENVLLSDWITLAQRLKRS